MKSFEIHKAKLDKSYTGINTTILGQAVGDLKYSGLKLYLYLASNKDGFNWTLNPQAYANWLGIDYEVSGRTVRKAITDGLADLIAQGYVEVIDEKAETYRFLEQKVPKITESACIILFSLEQFVPNLRNKKFRKNLIFGTKSSY